MRFISAFGLSAPLLLLGCGQPPGIVSIETATLRLTVDGTDGGRRETISIRQGDSWVPALRSDGAPTLIIASILEVLALSLMHS